MSVIIALAVLVTLFSFSVQGNAIPRNSGTAAPRRWLNPCGGRDQVVVDSSTSSAVHDWQPVSSGSTPTPLRDLVGRMNDTVEQLGVLQTVTLQLKAKLRERNNGNEEDLDEYLSYDIEGLRGPRQPANLSAATLTESAVNEYLRSAYEELSRVSVFINQSKTDEQEAISGSFEQIYARIERGDRNHSTGVFPILCNLRHLLDHRNEVLTQDVIDSIKAIAVPTGGRVFKLSRDWIVLTRLERLIVSIERAFVQIKEFALIPAANVQVNP